MIITSNLQFADWTQIFKDEQMTAALVDRLTHRVHIFVMNGDSYRFKQSISEIVIMKKLPTQRVDSFLP